MVLRWHRPGETCRMAAIVNWPKSITRPRNAVQMPSLKRSPGRLPGSSGEPGLDIKGFRRTAVWLNPARCGRVAGIQRAYTNGTALQYRTNTSGVSQLSPVEQAKNDARRVDVAGEHRATGNARRAGGWPGTWAGAGCRRLSTLTARAGPKSTRKSRRNIAR